MQSFAGFKAGMTHALVIDYRATSTTSGQEVQVPVTVIEVPPMKVAAIRLYARTHNGLEVCGEIWAAKTDKELDRLIPPRKGKGKAQAKDVDLDRVEEVRVLNYTQPYLVSGVPRKEPDLMETRVGGGTVKDRFEYAKSLLGKEIRITDFTKEGAMLDVAAVTKGKGWQGFTKRFGLKLLSHKNSKHRRMIGTRGNFNPPYIRPTVPQGGQMGYHQRTEYNKRVLKIGDNGADITPDGGFLHYGIIRNPYVLLHGSIPGPTKRLVRLRDAARMGRYVNLEKAPEMTHISKESKQGV